MNSSLITNMHRSKYSSLFSIILILFLIVNKSFQFNIPDQHMTFGKLFYYKLNMTKEQRNDVTKVDLMKISESGPAKLPNWLIFRNYTFIGFPIQQDNIKFISIVINYNKHKTLRDVFLINGIDQPNNKPPINNHDNKNCEIKLEKSFDSVDDLWNLIVYLMPKYLSEIINDNDNKANSNNNYLKPNANQAINEWAKDLFTVNGEEKDNKLFFNLLINNQLCSRDLNDFDDIQYKLTKLGLQFNVIKKILNSKDSNDDDDEDNQFFLNRHDSMLNDQWSMPNKNRRQVGKRLNIYSTPTLYPGWSSIPTSTVTLTGINPINPITNEDYSNNNLDTKDLTRIQPSLSTPDLQPTHTLPATPGLDQLSNLELLSTPHYNPASVINNNIYTTPSFAPEAPTDYLTTADLITPTPTITFIVSDTAKEFSFSSLESISPSLVSSTALVDATSSVSIDQPEAITTLNPISSSSETSSSTPFLNTTLDAIKTTTFKPISSTTTTTTTTTTEKPVNKKPKIYSGNVPDHAPVIRERIPKLRLTSGVYWRYVIPEDTFNDFEKGNTRNLELQFSPIDENSDNIAPADLFIQFDRENQILTALPTEDHIGKYKFQLSAADSSGQIVNDELEISVVQHKLSRSFTHKFILENVVWNSNTPLIEGVNNLMRKIANLFKDRETDSIFLQKIEFVKQDQQNRVWNIYWTNSSLKTYPCPSAEIQNIFNALAANGHKYKEGQSALPNQLLRKTIEPEYQIGTIKYQLASTCTRIDTTLLKDKMPQLRNITFELGSIFQYQIPSDTFISSKQTDTRDLELELVSPSGYIVDRRDCIGFEPKNQTIYGLALNEKLIDENLDYRLIARDRDSNLNAFDVFVLQILQDRLKQQYTHEITMQFKPKINVDMDLNSKVQIATRFVNSVFDGNINSFKVLKIKRHRYEPQYKTNYDYHRKKRNIQSNILSRTFYEYVLTSKSFASNLNCQSDQIQRHIVTRIFNVSNTEPEARLDQLKKIFPSDYELVYIGFRSIGKCKNQISPTYIGSKLIAEMKSSEYDEIFTTTDLNILGNGPVQPSTTQTETNRDEIMLNTVVPVLILIICLLLISCLIIVIYVRFRHNIDKKNRFDINPNMHGVGEAESFLQKGRNPVILETDLNPNMHLLHHQQQQQIYNPMTPMKQLNQFNRSPYTTHEPHRRPPPAYMNPN